MATVSATRPDAQVMAAVRDELPAVQVWSYLNTGTNGPLPRRSHETLVRYEEEEVETGRIGAAAWHRVAEIKGEVRARFASLLGCDASEIALTHCTTEGMNIGLFGLDWRPGDEIVTSLTEHPGALNPIAVIARRFGARVRQTRIGQPDLDCAAELKRVLTPRTRAVALSHVCWTTGMVLPIRELADLAHTAGALMIVDAAQSCGMVPSKMDELGVDVYACSGQKWLCGPDGTGAAYVRTDSFGDIAQTYVNYHSFGGWEESGYYLPAASAERYEGVTLHPPSLAAFNTGLAWIEDELDWEWVYARIARLGRLCHEALAAVPGVTVHTPATAMAGLVHFTLDGVEPADLTARLAERQILIRHTPRPAYNRVSTGFYNTEEEIQALADAIRELARG